MTFKTLCLCASVVVLPLLTSCGATAESLRVGTNSAMATVKITRSVEVSGIKAEHGLEAVLAEAAKVEGANNGR
ncbi:hypothetical protein HZB60_04045 [candidate division KSB1 bacterium]|nr:hypothetical protein [candidate division KSB1 bacterium]